MKWFAMQAGKWCRRLKKGVEIHSTRAIAERGWARWAQEHLFVAEKIELVRDD